MSIEERSNSLLESQLLKENKPFNYKLLSRELNIHVNDAKKLLYTFYKKHSDSITVNFIIIGKHKEIDGTTIKVTENIEDKENFQSIETIQVYSLAPKNITINEALTTIKAQLKNKPVTEENLAKWGVIKGPELIALDTVLTAPISSDKKTSSAFETKKVSPKKPKSEGSIKSERKSGFPEMGSLRDRMLARNKKEEPKNAIQSPSLSRQGTEKIAKPLNISANKRAKTDPTPTVETLEDDLLNDEEYIAKQKFEKEAQLKKQKELERMFDDDDDEEQDEDVNDVKNGIRKRKDNEKGLEEIFDSSFSQSPVKTSPTKKDKQPAVESEEERVQDEDNREEIDEPKADSKEESVTSYYDEDGYLVTKVEKSKPIVKTMKRSPSPATSNPSTKKSKIASSAKQQSSLLSFFGKK
ncbi:hypothetical protein WICMUC_004214 [Wickerhamomyces mucosus]|uniref:DNA polymerase delta subunit 3 n=1 Tax=Wickerhamomyces mucosus TaxID=1378264 RepID=A0A9P8TBD1_9ASCO|nr:hypothetical protein WICMUC_004214 [Wickerhamomyces mucosus]